MARPSITRMLQPRKAGPPRLPSFDISAGAAAHTVYLPGSIHERSEHLLLNASLSGVLSDVQAFARGELAQWRKRDETVDLSGPRVSVVYAYDRAQFFQLKPRTFRARWNAQAEALRTGKSVLMKDVPYEFELRLDIAQQAAHGIAVAAVLTETIDRRNTLAEYPVGHHFWAPSVINMEPWFDACLAALRRVA